MSRGKCLFAIGVMSFIACRAESAVNIDGTWRSRTMEPAEAGFQVRTFVNKSPNYTSTTEYYLTMDPKSLFLVLETKGTYTSEPSRRNPAVADLNYTVSSCTMIHKSAADTSDPLGIKKCAPVGVTVDLLKTPCGKFNTPQPNKTYYQVALPTSSMLFMGAGRFFADKETLRPAVVSVLGLEKK